MGEYFTVKKKLKIGAYPHFGKVKEVKFLGTLQQESEIKKVLQGFGVQKITVFKGMQL